MQHLADRDAAHDSHFDEHATRLTALEAFQAALPNLDLQVGRQAVSFTNQSLHTRVLTSPRPFPTAPSVFCSLESGSGVTGRWDARAFNITAQGFPLFCYPNNIGDTSSWSNIPVSRLALTIG
ncbi:H-type lectin domain-containing protein [Glycomyces sp. A-F 0318]|uniref:H-type lectin domain-containing protein n=1 Tax=Glycomyces amatae TaxID=2881355 RepID=UPI001E4617FE|nr:H-type lectin domain-containing protein [Glycomyces amatae]MCD0446452.1 H-type lectin domain-containing protein [Glycomyces amatae]